MTDQSWKRSERESTELGIERSSAGSEATDEPEHEDVVSEQVEVPDAGPTIRMRRDLEVADSRIRSEVTVPVCGQCGLILSPAGFGFCYNDSAKLCQDCRTPYDGRTYCRTCLLEALELSKLDYKVLRVVAEGIRDKRLIASFAKATKEEVKESIERLRDLGYLTRAGLSIFSKHELPSKAHDAIQACDKAFKNEPDVQELLSKLAQEAEE